jgi:GntR family transcriptional repressor for pyruvate dehydrogenase complex
MEPDKGDQPRRTRVETSWFAPIVGPSVSDEIVEQLTFAIRSGAYRVGDRLPTVPELAQVLGVSRPTVSKAVNDLAAHGVLEVRRGATGGITVASSAIPARALRHAIPVRAASLRELVEARRPVEIALVRLAAERADEADFEDLRYANHLLESTPQEEHEGWGFANNLFHYTIGRSARSSVLAFVQHQLLEEMTIMLEGYDQRYSSRERTIREHHDTLTALETRDPDRAAASMEEHLKELEGVAEWYETSAPKVSGSTR